MSRKSAREATDDRGRRCEIKEDEKEKAESKRQAKIN
jgi:hypothetical protein